MSTPEEKRLDILITASVAACDNASRQYDDYGKTFTALDTKAQAVVTMAGVILAAIVTLTNSGRLGQLVGSSSGPVVALGVLTICMTLVCMALGFYASRVTPVSVPFAAHDQIQEVDDLLHLPADEVSKEKLLGYHAARMKHWKASLANIAQAVERKAVLVRAAQWGIVATLGVGMGALLLAFGR
ncbi:MAG: hypothetical protein KF892_07275 [Rhizobacter sp.]|nr:hypothetical protein [Rhizobacter sp.]